MLKRIPSSREPGVTLWTEIHSEFAVHFTRFRQWTAIRLESKPKLGLWIMLVVLLISTGLSFTVFRSPKPRNKKQENALSPEMHQGIDQLLSMTAAIRENVRLKHLVDSIAAKQVLTPADSTALDSALSRLDHLRNIIYHP